MSITQLFLCVHNSIFQQVIIPFSVIKQQRINDVQQVFKLVFKILIFTSIGAIEHNIQFVLQFKMSIT